MPHLMVQGTGSDAGKSLLVAGLCRWLQRQGLRVAPFKPQNMALNSAVTVDGGEIGRAQALQAQAAGLEPHTDMNPVLLKPGSDTAAQVIIQGQVYRDMNAAEFHDYKRVAQAAVLESWRRLVRQYEHVIVEGAGSPAEVNLREGDIANMGFAEAVDCPVILIADIERGGVFASLVGTLELLSPSERARVRGFVINRFRGDRALLKPGLDWLQQRTGKPVLGVLPWLPSLHLDAEDAVQTQQSADRPRFKVLVPVLPHISNHTDFDVLRLQPEVDLCFAAPGEPLPDADWIILPGSKQVRHDLGALRRWGWDTAIRRHLRYGGKLLGLCGGMQMLGEVIADPDGLEGEAGTTPGLNLLEFSTRLHRTKQLRQVQARLQIGAGAACRGYEIHCGLSEGPALTQPLLRLADGQGEGAISPDGQIIASYVHGLLDEPESCQALLRWAGLDLARPLSLAAAREASLDRLADVIAAELDWGGLLPELFPKAGAA